MKRAEFLDDVGKILGNREKQYGSPDAVFEAIAQMISAYLTERLGIPVTVTKSDVAVIQIINKIARIGVNMGHMDSWADIVGYAACGVEAGHIAENGARHETEKEECEEGRCPVFTKPGCVELGNEKWAGIELRAFGHSGDPESTGRLCGAIAAAGAWETAAEKPREIHGRDL